VEGEGSLYVKVQRGQVREVRFGIFEPPRFYEAFLRGRRYDEAPDITARICGICPIAYIMSSIGAMEDAFGVTVEGQLRNLRRLIYCGEWIESHSLHVFMLHAPDFLGYEDAIRMSKDHPKEVELALKLKKIGNDLVTLVGGREIHPVNVRVGGFYRLPSRSELKSMVEPLRWALEASVKATEWVAKLKYPEFEREYEYVSLRHPDEYPLTEGRVVSSKGLDIPLRDYEKHFTEEHMPHSNALHSYLNERGAYHVGPMARFNLNFDKLTPKAQKAAKNAGIGKGCHNPFKSIIVRSVETVFACEEAIRIIDQYEEPAEAVVPIQTRAAVGCGASEAPRGLLYHRYRLDERGIILDAKITPPTAQNQKVIEQDLAELVPKIVHRPEAEITWQCEQAIRNYDPCISCATHFLRLHLERE
jgi:coenzyme F420-reducing hydrogenase alpha subunit